MTRALTGCLDPSEFADRLDRYTVVKARFPHEGRRKWRLRIAEEFFALALEDKQKYVAAVPVPVAEAEDAEYSTDDDPLDDATDAPGLGVVVRTDFSNEEAWQAFSEKLQAAEAEFSSAPSNEPKKAESSTAGETSRDADEEMDEDGPEADEAELDESDTAPIFNVINPTATSGCEWLQDISNLTALRLFNDVDIRPAPAPATGEKRIKPPNRLVDYHGWQEIYIGKTLWIYDARSNTDQCVRLVGQQGAMYGTATGDSWRARVSHICELQVNLASGAMTIDFGGQDRWDYPERVRNMEEAERPIA
ncbi:uncharacterized protein PHACADRAFT_175053 [Phanerochaete carnosa HHB-10118-sp]|uniref:Uncharacterized protein n=1 Tax=Phanerochaete carnosa (strain HHB-10118-sp) TaxID=650164 RepID=K5UWT9_PHACS|nr:uncharacterized protein PHACADRAFT_175053 [Phanerochaete carnosa HHB-10118-sp]EKM54531.1 hypothetical protein PHACADRAFT_175053 [Phanerochaete carnosa HHB-10118-sp]